MTEIDRKNYIQSSSDQYHQDFSDEELMSFVIQLMMAVEIQNYIENSFRDNNLTPKLDKLLFDIEKELVDLTEEVNA